MKKRIMVCLLSLIAASMFLQAQSKQYFVAPLNKDTFNLDNAIRVWTSQWQLSRKDTLVRVYITQDVYWKKPRDSAGVATFTEYKFSVDSIRGRGDQRHAYLRRTYKTKDSTQWYRTHLDTGYARPDTVVRRTTDSTNQVGKWMTPTPPNGITATWGMYFPTSLWGTWFPDSTALNITLDRCIGDPTKNFGLLQRAELRFTFSDLRVLYQAQALMKNP